MSAISNATKTVLSCLRTSGMEMTAADIRKNTKLPLAVITRSLQSIANELVSHVERKERDGRVYYSYVGPITDDEDGLTPAPTPAPSKKETKPKRIAKKESVSPAKKVAKKQPKEPLKQTDPTPRPVSTPKQANQKTIANKVDPGLVYKLIGKHLTVVPMNITRLSNETGVAQADLLPALRALTDAGLITQREMLEDVVYRGAGDLKSKIDLMDLPSSAISEPDPQIEGLTQTRDELTESIALYRKTLENNESVAREFVEKGIALSDQMQNLIAEIQEWRSHLRSFLDRSKP